MYEAAITVGVFDMLHEGHINLLNQMRDMADSVHVIVHDDYSTFQNKGRFPVQEVDHRVRNIERLGWVSVRRCFKADPSRAIWSVVASLRPAKTVYVRGNDWLEFPGREELEALNVPIQFVEYTIGVSSSERRDEL